ncbi:unnamed protein product [Dibothriocephalus latus]|uniref:Uncharacterized protein n=1 Tax=Dibothriocephalus latus TaxID=60516 RepID=A0A3P7M3P1_DIBLA|nr:unnamed protein product [Dibothriocephalus latus]
MSDRVTTFHPEGTPKSERDALELAFCLSTHHAKTRPLKNDYKDSKGHGSISLKVDAGFPSHANSSQKPCASNHHIYGLKARNCIKACPLQQSPQQLHDIVYLRDDP